MVGFDDQDITALQMVADTRGHIAQVGRVPNLDTLRTERETHRIHRVMRDCEWHYFNIPDHKPLTCVEVLELLKLGAVSLRLEELSPSLWVAPVMKTEYPAWLPGVATPAT
jgi:hypothetical protein